VVVDLWRDAIVNVFGEENHRRLSAPLYLCAQDIEPAGS
jgi:hypothetical protein